MYFMEWCYICCKHPHLMYLNADGTIDKDDLDRMIDRSIDEWHEDRRERWIEYYPTNQLHKKLKAKKKR